MIELYNLPKVWKREVISVGQRQGYLPNSPGEYSSTGEVQLCAAACIAYAGLKLKEPSNAKKFSEKIGQSRDKNIIIDAFKNLGLSESVCASVLALNDASHPEERLDMLIGLLNCYEEEL